MPPRPLSFSPGSLSEEMMCISPLWCSTAFIVSFNPGLSSSCIFFLTKLSVTKSVCIAPVCAASSTS